MQITRNSITFPTHPVETGIEHNVSPSPYQVGDQVEMLYNADNPQQYYIPHSSGGNWVFLFGGAFFFLMGLGFTVLIVKMWLLPLIFGAK